MYAADLCTLPASLAGLPAISVPCGLSEGLPVGLQIMAPVREDARLYRVGATVEALQDAEWGAPLLSRAPRLGWPVPVPGFGTEPDGGTR